MSSPVDGNGKRDDPSAYAPKWVRDSNREGSRENTNPQQSEQPAGTPPAVVKKLNAALREIIDSPDVQASFKNIGFEGFSSTPEELGDFIKAQLSVWKKMVKDADIKPN